MSEQPRDAMGRWSAVGFYISEDGFGLNEQLRGGDDSSPNVERMDKIISENGQVYEDQLYRGASSELTESLMMQAGINRISEDTDYTEAFRGQEFTDDAYLSTSRDYSIANEFAERGAGAGAIFIIEPSTVASLNVSDIMGADVDWQEENIFPRGSTLTINRAYSADTTHGQLAMVFEVSVE